MSALTAVAGPARRGLASLRVLAIAVLPLVVGLFLAGAVENTPEPVPWPVKVLGILVGLGQGVALYWRHSHPRTVMALTLVGGAFIQVIASYALFPYAGMIAIWALTTAQPPRSSLPALAALIGVTALSWPGESPGDTEFAIAVVIVIWALAEATRSRRTAIAQATQRATEREQARLARELHDVIAHSVSVIVVQAAAGDDVFEHSPTAARQALRSIETTGRETLAELRRLLAATGPVPPESRQPQPDLHRLEELAEPIRSVGLRVSIRRMDDEQAVIPAGVQLSAYRIIQEALTNIVRHAQASCVEIRIAAGHDALELAVTDDGTSNPARPGAAGPGRGIVGMRERARLLGGTLEAGHRSEGGFQVRARLPLRPPA